MAWCEANGVDYIFGLAGNAVLHRFTYDAGDDLNLPSRRAVVVRCQALKQLPVLNAGQADLRARHR